MRSLQLRQSAFALSSVRSRRHARLILWVGVVLFLLYFRADLLRGQTPPAQGYLYQERSLKAADVGIEAPADLAFLPVSSSLLVVDGDNAGAAFLLSPRPEAAARMVALDDRRKGSVAVAFDPDSTNLLLYYPLERELVQIPLGPNGEALTAGRRVTRFDPHDFGLAQIIDITFDATAGRLLLLDGTGLGVTAVTPHSQRGFDVGTAARSGGCNRCPCPRWPALRLPVLRRIRRQAISS